MKKIALVLFLAGLILVVSSVYVVTRINYIKVKNSNDSIQKILKEIDIDSKTENDNSITLNDELAKLKENLKKEINEYDVWVKTKEKLNSIISS